MAVNVLKEKNSLILKFLVLNDEFNSRYKRDVRMLQLVKGRVWLCKKSMHLR